MLKMRYAGKSHAEIGKHFGISKQRVMQIIGSVRLTKRYVRNGAEASQDSTKRGVKGILDKIVLKVKKFV